MIVNWRQLSLNWTWIIHKYICGSLIILCWLNVTSQSVVWNVFYTSAISSGVARGAAGPGRHVCLWSEQIDEMFTQTST